MGAWGTGIFDDDAACDFLDDLASASTPFAVMADAFQGAMGAEYLEYDDGQAALVSAAVIDAVCRGVSLDGADGDEGAWLSGLDAAQAKPLRGAAAGACRRLLGAGSELQELWAENEEDFPAWRAQIEGLAARLAA
jgi:hypothetical protein